MAAVVAAPDQHLAAGEATRPVAAEVTSVVEVTGVVIRAAGVAEVEVIPEVVDIPATTKRVDCKLM
jgi:hypothetical protein